MLSERRGGKSRALATLATYIAALCEHKLSPGEKGVVLCVSPDLKQSAIVLEYCAAALERSPILRQLIVSRSSDLIELRGNISIEVRAASFRRLRGPTYLCCIADECAFWYSDEWSSNTDVEILNAIRPGLATSGGPLIIASSPYARRGVLWSAFKSNFNADGDPAILVAQGGSVRFNPSLSQRIVDRAYERDAISARAEYGAQFRSDIEAFVSQEVVESCMSENVELPPVEKIKYVAFCDPSGGSSDSFTLAIAHAASEPRASGIQDVLIDAIREAKPPFSPEGVVDDFCTLLKSYRINRVSGDRFGGEWPREQFRKRGVAYRLAEKVKSDLYRDLLPLLNSGRIILPKSDKLATQLTGLERRVSRGGKDSIDHSPNAHDDICNSVAGAADLIAGQRKSEPPWSGSYDNIYGVKKNVVAEAERNVLAGSLPCTLSFAEKPLAEGLSRRVGAPIIWSSSR